MFTRDNTNDLFTDEKLHIMNVELAENMLGYGQFQLNIQTLKNEMEKILSKTVPDKIYK